MLSRLQAWYDGLGRDPNTGDRVLFSDPGVGRMFARCLSCGRVMPHYFAVFTAGERKSLGCKCGHTKFSPANLPVYQQIWWLFVRGFLVRKLLLRRTRWDPRLPVRL